MPELDILSATVPGRYWHALADGRIQCDLCPRFCRLHEGQRGMCFVRARDRDRMVLTTHGRSSGFRIDPVEKKPLHHFLPGTPAFSFGTAGCNLACKFCQNWQISKSRQMDSLAEAATPEKIARVARGMSARSVAFTYNDPVIYPEYAIEVAQACREAGLKTIAVTAGYICPEPRAELFQAMDAANVDLKGFSEGFYRRLCGGHLAPVLETLRYLRRQTQVWLELTTLLIPGENDSEEELERLTGWVAGELGTQTPLHFTAFYPNFKMVTRPITPEETLVRARQIALRNGLRFVYCVSPDPASSATACPSCGQTCIQRTGYRITGWQLTPEGACQACGARLPGVYEAAPGEWGAQYLPVRLADFTAPGQSTPSDQ